MGKKKQTTPSKGKKSPKSPKQKEEEEEKQIQNKKSLTLQAMEEMSSSEEGDDDDENEEEWNEQAKALKQSIMEGAFDHLIKENEKSKDDDSDEENFEDVVLGEETEDGKTNKKEEKKNKEIEKEDSEDSDEEEEEEDSEDSEDDEEEGKEEKEKEEEEEEEEEEEDDEEEEDKEDDDDDDEKQPRRIQNQQQQPNSDGKALVTITNELVARSNQLPWIEKNTIVASTKSVPAFTSKAIVPDSTDVVSIHDDLKRELIFYKLALESCQKAKIAYIQQKVPFTRPNDYFVEMVKTDDHMAKVKDRLIFESKKITAVAERKANQEQKLRVRESRANSLAEKSKRKKENMKSMQEWATQQNNMDSNETSITKKNKKQKGRGWIDEDGSINYGPNKKRINANKKYGHNWDKKNNKRGHFKQPNDPKSMNDLSGYNPKGNFAGGMKRSAGSGSGNKRPGKRARDAKRR